MFILNNIHDRKYRGIYPEIKNVIFDISEKQIKNKKNSAWLELLSGHIVCVVTSSRKISTLFRVSGVEGLGDHDEEGGETFVLKGMVVGKLNKEQKMESLLNQFKVEHHYLPNNKFSIGFNVANLGNALDPLSIKTKNGEMTVHELKALS